MSSYFLLTATVSMNKALLHWQDLAGCFAIRPGKSDNVESSPCPASSLLL